MAIYSNRRDVNGTHIISGGHSSNDTSGKRGYPFEPPLKSLNLNLQSYGSSDRLLEGANNTYRLNGSADLTDPTSISVYLNGMVLDERDYELDMGAIKIKRFIKPSDDDLEVRSKEDHNVKNISNVLILEVTPGLIETEDLTHYTPKYGDVLNVSRLAQIEHNQKNSTFVMETQGKNVTAYVLSHRIQKNGIYARVKIKEVRESDE